MKHLEIARGELGKAEVPNGSNWGPHVQKYLASVGITFPASWCMAFVYWCAKSAYPNQDEGGLKRTGGVLDQWNSRPALRVKTPQPGDIFIMDFGKGLGHTGIVEQVLGDKILTIEGNTNDEGSREGYEVAKRTRNISSCKGFLRIPKNFTT